MPISLRSFSRPCSGRTAPVPHLGPPMAPSRTASADLAASRASSVSGLPLASMEHCGEVFVSLPVGQTLARPRTGRGIERKVEEGEWL